MSGRQEDFGDAMSYVVTDPPIRVQISFLPQPGRKSQHQPVNGYPFNHGRFPPQLIFHDLALLKKVQHDYPIAAIEFQKLLRDSRAAASASDGDELPHDILERINSTIVIPGVKKIEYEFSQLLKNQAVATVTEVTGITLPLALSYAVTPEEYFTKLLGAGVGLLWRSHRPSIHESRFSYSDFSVPSTTPLFIGSPTCERLL